MIRLIIPTPPEELAPARAPQPFPPEWLNSLSEEDRKSSAMQEFYRRMLDSGSERARHLVRVALSVEGDADAPSDAAISIIAVEGRLTGLVFERAIDTIGHRAHLVPQSGFENVAAPDHNLLGQPGGY